MAFRYSYTKLSEEPEDTESGFGIPPRHGRRKDPEAEASWFSYLFLYWLDPLFWLGFRHDLEHSDLYPHPVDTDSRRMLKTFNKHWRREIAHRPGERARLWLVVARCLWWQLIVTGVMLFFQVASQVTESILVGELAHYFTIEDPTVKETRHAYLSAAGIVVLALCVAVYFAQATLLATKIGMMTRIMLTAAIYQKVLRLSQATLGSQSVGRIITLASNDVQRFDLAFILLHYIWISMLSLCVSTLLIYFHVGWSAFLAVAIIFVLEPTEAFLTWLYTEVRIKSGSFTDERVKTMNEIITGMKVIKMYAWEYPFGRIVKKLRRREAVMVFLSTLIQLSATYLTWITFPPILSFAIFVPYTALGGELSPRIVFTTLSLLSFLAVHLNYSLQGILRLAEGLVGIRRIKELLLLEELPPIARRTSFQYHSASSSDSSSPQKSPESIPLLRESSYISSFPSLKDEPSDPFIRVSNLSVFYGDNLVIENLSFEMDHNSSPLAVVGPVGSGKSTLLQCLIGELRPVEGSVEVCGRVSYASQQPWVFSGTVRDNVLFGLPFQKDWYNTVVQACTLDKDFEQLPDGDQTLVGERGAALSGGQKQRVNLARAIYNEADIYLLDDPLSAVDAAVAKHLFENAICGLLRDKLVILVTHHTYFALQAKQILDIEDGEVKTCDPTTLPPGLSELEEAESEFTVGFSIDPKPVEVKPRTSISEAHTSLESVLDEESPTTLYTEDRAHGSISMATYYKYFRAGGNHLFLLLVLASFLIGEGSIVLEDLWLADWAECSAGNTSVFEGKATCKLSVDERIEIYSGILGFAIILNFAKTVAFSYLCVNASRVLHNRMFSAVLRAPMRFFDTCPSGAMLNRFSMDIGLLDTITYRYYLCLLLLMEFIAVMVLATVLNYWLLFAVAALVFLVLSLRWYYISTAQNIKRLEAVARSPLYSHISTTLQGLPTIRIFGKEYIAFNLFHQFLNSHTQAWWLYLASVRWFSMRVDVISALFTAVVAFTSLPLSSVLDAGLVGLGLTYTISLADNLQLCVRISCEVENYMVSAERIMEYTKLQSEASLETKPPENKPPPNWPDQGHLEMHDVSFRYASDLPLTLNNLTLSVEPREKIGIVGRTGAGKSSLLSVLFRMAEPLGKVIIDGINVQEIGLHDLRKNISIIPQDPVLFSGSLRYNLDPFAEYSDEEVWDALEQVQLKLVIENLDNQLQCQVSEGASNFSVGQRQLVCLARALLRRNKILVLDEATANVDRKTDSMIQQIIQDQFVQCTVLTIAHRLDTVMDADRILVMDKGCVSEFGAPLLLLQNPASHLKRMVDKTGPDASKKLHQMAIDAHQRRQ